MNQRLSKLATPTKLGWFILLAGFLFAPVTLGAQDRPLQTPDAETVASGTVRTSTGFDFLQDQKIPFSGLKGDLTSVGVLDLRVGVGKIVELQLQGAARNFLSIKEQGASFTTLNLPSSSSTSDSGDFSLWTKVRIIGEGKRRPAVAFRFGFEMPNSNQARGIGTNSTNVFAMVILEKHIGKLKLFGDLGLGILQSPLQLFSQNDELLYGGAFSYPIFRRVDLVGEVSGRQSTRRITSALVGTESRGQARLGVQILAGGFQWDVAGIAGIYHNDARTGFTFGVSRDIPLFKIPSESK
ncbi:MAG: hypothetical protein ACRD4K_14905 [Candidatus Acidiferrales bacterium]